MRRLACCQWSPPISTPAATAAHDALRVATGAAHERVDGVLGGGLHSADDYRAYLRGMHRFVSDGQAALAQVPNGLADQRERLERDLGALQIVPLPASARPAAVVDRPGQLGWGYVFAGSSLGARFLLREARSLGYAPGAGADFLSGHAGGDAWPTFLRELDAAALSDTDHPRLCAAATEAFGHAESALRCAKEALA